VCTDTLSMKLSEYAQRHGMTYKGAWHRYKTGGIKGAYVDDTGHIWVPEPNEARLPYAAVYARVSSHPQADDLERQCQRMVQYANARGYQVVSVTKEIASGVNDERPKLTKVLQDETWGTLVVEHKDRLTRVGFGWFDVLLQSQGRKIDVANPVQDNVTDLTEDLLSILYSFAARLYGKRGAKSRAQKAANTLGAGTVKTAVHTTKSKVKE